MWYQSLQELTGQESGAILYEDGQTIWIGNWCGVSGIPRGLAFATVGLGENLIARRTATPSTVKRAMRDHARLPENGGEDTPTGWKSWRVNDGVTVTVNTYWN